MNQFNKLKLNAASISFLPILVCIPLSYQLIINLHSGGVDLFQEFILSAFHPKINYETSIIVINKLIETIYISLSSWLISIIFGIIFGILSSNIFYEIINIPIFFKATIKFFLTIIRSIHEIVLGILLMQIYGLNFSIGIIAICIPYIAVNAKVFSEQLDNIDQKRFKSIKQINGPGFSTLITLIWHPIINTFKNFGIYRIECSIRSTVILGIFGIGGIGTSIILSFQTLNFSELWTYLWALIFLIIFSREIIKKIRFKNNPKTLSIFLIGIVFSIILFCFYYTFSFILNNNFDKSYLINYFLKSDSHLLNFNFLKLILDTIILSLFSTGIAISFPPVLILILNNNFGLILIRSLAFLLRLIPTPVLILSLLTFNSPSISLAAFTLGIHNAGITSKLLLTNLKSMDKRNYIAMKSLGFSRNASWLLGLFPDQAKSYLAYCAYRSDIIIRETAIVGVIGGVGLGWQLQESLSSFAGKEVALILVAYSSIAIVGELINGKIKNSLT